MSHNTLSSWVCNTSPIWGVEAIIELIPIHFHLNKLSRRYQLRVAFLPKNYALNLLLNNQHSKKVILYWLLLGNLMSKQHLKLKSSIVNSNNHLNSLFSFFNNLHKKLSAGFQSVDSFSDHFSFYIVNHKNKGIYHSFATVMCNIMLTLNPKFKNKKINRK